MIVIAVTRASYLWSVTQCVNLIYIYIYIYLILKLGHTNICHISLTNCSEYFTRIVIAIQITKQIAKQKAGEAFFHSKILWCNITVQSKVINADFTGRFVLKAQ